ncbi:MAG TPA: hypothetical protein VFQ38_15525 [Longimicrobiales bacterium]|nr:hypothetical protein [Longimicrobiales bacterium]
MRAIVIVGALVAAAVAGGLVGCDPDATAPVAPEGTFDLVAVSPPIGGGPRLRIPAAIPMTSPGDSVRYVGGAFTLGAGRTWHVRLEQELVFDGRPPRRRVLEDGGRYAASRSGRQLVLDLYPGQGVLQNVPMLAIVSGDSVFYDAFLFAR